MRKRTNHVSQGTPTARVLPFRPRTSASVPHSGAAPAGQNETTESLPDDFRHRMIVNAAGFACALTLTAAGIWLASSLSNLRRDQDCVLSGRRDCASIVAVDKQSEPVRQH